MAVAPCFAMTYFGSIFGAVPYLLLLEYSHGIAFHKPMVKPVVNHLLLEPWPCPCSCWNLGRVDVPAPCWILEPSLRGPWVCPPLLYIVSTPLLQYTRTLRKHRTPVCLFFTLPSLCYLQLQISALAKNFGTACAFLQVWVWLGFESWPGAGG